MHARVTGRLGSACAHGLRGWRAPPPNRLEAWWREPRIVKPYRRHRANRWWVLAALWFAVVPAAARPAAPLLTGSLLPQTVADAAKPAPAAGHLLILGFAGDLGFSGDGDVPSTEGAVKHGAVIPWARLTAAITPLLAADANFANLETVIAESRDLPPVEKSYNFMGDPAGLRHAVAMGITVLTTANNHAGDFGSLGIVETLSHLAAARHQGLKAYAGLGIGTDRYRADVFSLGGAKLGVGAIGLGINHAGPEGPGQPLYASPQDFDRVLNQLASTQANLRVLSVHYGKELMSLPGERDMARFRRAVDAGKADVVFGHHAHVASGMEYRNGKLILYGLGNFLHSGTQDMSRYGACRDFGLYAKAYFWLEPGAPARLRAVELFPIRGMHAVPEPLPREDAARRIAILNTLNAAVSGEGSTPVRLETTSHGTGLACFGDQSTYGDELAVRCVVSGGPRGASMLTAAALPASCGIAPPPGPLVEVARQQPPVPTSRPRPTASSTPKIPSKSAAAERPRRKSFSLFKLID